MEEELAHNIREYAKRKIAEETDGQHRDKYFINSILEKAAHYNMPKENQMPRNWNNCLDFIESSENLLLLTDTDISWELGTMIEQTLQNDVSNLQDATMVEQPEGTDQEDIERFIETREKKIEKVKQMKEDE